MRRIVVLLGVALGWVAIHHLSKASLASPAAARGDTYPFPTSASHESIDRFDEGEVPRWAARLGCHEDQLRNAIDHVGTSIERLREYLAMPSGASAR